ncbi:MAG: glycosyltransferase [Planctomycetes bacterium]|nr:glycosyltransferase [Planctomycetota bacterium]
MRALLQALLLLVVALPVAVVTALVAVIVLLAAVVVDLAWTPVVWARRRPFAFRARDLRGASIVTVTWNGKHHLEGLLPSLRREIAAHGGDHEVIVVDNGSTDGTVAWLAAEHPWVKVVPLPENRYFVRGNKAGVEHATRDVLVFLNNDMVVQPGFLGPLLDGLRDPKVFAVAAEIFFKDPGKRREESGRTRGELRNGWLQLAHEMPSRDERELDYVPTFWAGGGSAAFDRRMYEAIGGFDELYDPFYMEDVGLSYEAWKRGFRVLFTARSSVLHEHRGTSRKAFGDEFVDAMIRRNQHLFLWRNLTSWRAFAPLLLAQPLAIVLRSKRPGRGRAYGLWFELRAMLRALPRLPQALGKRCAGRLHHTRSDEQVFAAANSIAAHRRADDTRLGRLPAPSPRGLRVLVLAARLPRLGVDGSWVVFRRLVEHAKTHRVTLFAFVEAGDDASAAQALREHGIEVVTAVRVRNPMPGNLHHSVPRRLFRDYGAPSMRAMVQRMLESTDHDVVQVEYVEMLHLLRGLPIVAPVVYTCHESLALAAARDGSGVYRTMQARAHELTVLRAVDHVVALSGADAEALRTAGHRGPVTVVPSGIDVAQFSAGSAAVAAQHATVTFVGYFRHEPNVDAAIWLCESILPSLRQLAPGVGVRLVGRDAPPRVQALAGADVQVAGFVPDLAAELAAATVVVLPLRTGGGLRGKLLEAWAAARPVVATPVAIEGTNARDGEHCLVAADADAFAAGVAALLQDADRRARLGAAGRALVTSQHSMARVAARYDEVFAALVGRRP